MSRVSNEFATRTCEFSRASKTHIKGLASSTRFVNFCTRDAQQIHARAHVVRRRSQPATRAGLSHAFDQRVASEGNGTARTGLRFQTADVLARRALDEFVGVFVVARKVGADAEIGTALDEQSRRGQSDIPK